jgi:hypothetical protein
MGVSKRNHVVPIGYLRAWAHEGRIAMRLVGSSEATDISPRDAAVRVGFYVERAAGGETSDAFEKRLARVEGVLLPAVQNAATGWPPDKITRGRIAEFMALQAVRGPGWRAFHADAVGNAAGNLPPRWSHVPATVIAAVQRHLLTDRERHTRMAEQVFLLATMLANMHWTVLTCDEALLATSDHPIVSLPLGDVPVQTTPIPVGGMWNTSEVRVALSPRHLLVATWRDEIDGQAPRVASAEQILNHNTLVISQAESQWFHVPGSDVAYGDGPCGPIAVELFGSYSAEESSRRRHVAELLEKQLDAEPEQRHQVLIAEWGPATT